MNTKELKKLAAAWDNAPRGTAAESGGAYEMFEAIMALPDDPQAEHEDLVEMARALLKVEINDSWVSDASILASMVIERFGKREPRKVELWAVMRGEWVVISNFDEEHAQKFVREHPGEGYWLAQITGTEEV